MDYTVPELRTINVIRYVTPLREGGSLPAIIEGDDQFLYVLKFRGAGQGSKALIAELIGGEIARMLGLKVPEIVFANLDSAFGRIEGDEEIQDLLIFSEMLIGCDAYIATGSNNSSGYFEYYFGKYPHIIRRNRTSAAILTGQETNEELDKLADDVYLYFGLGCRNVTKLYVPEGYDFIPLLTVFKKYNYLADNHKYKNNYDYNLAIHLLNKKFYMSNESFLLVEEASLFSPISQLNYEYYSDPESLINSLKQNKDLQAIAGKNFIPFGDTQKPSLNDYADGVDTMAFLLRL